MPNASCFIGLPFRYKQLCTIYPPSVKDILDNDNSMRYCNILTLSKDDIEDIIIAQKRKAKESTDNLVIPNPLNYLLSQCKMSDETSQLVKEAFKFFIRQDVLLLTGQNLILIGSLSEVSKISDVTEYKIISEENFLGFQNAIRESMGLPDVIPPVPDEDPQVEAIKAKGRRRDRLARKRKAKEQEKISFATYLAAICCMGIGITPLNIGEISYASVSMLIRLYQTKEKYDIDLRSIFAGADPKKVKPKYWIYEESDFHEVQI